MRIPAFLVLLLAAACAGEPLSPADAPEAAPPGTRQDTGVVTDAAVYVLHELWDGLAFDVEITLHNRSAQPLYIVNCNGALAPSLERKTAAGWMPWWAGVSPLCLSPPIVIAPGESLERELRIWGALPGRNAAPAWPSADVPGTYRLRLHNLVYNYTDRGQSFGDPVPAEQQLSNEFVLRR